jgi:GT2 family glycosyltransferase
VSVGVFIVTHNHASTLPAVLDSLRGQDFPARVVVVDNASQDGSAGLAQSFARALPLQVLALGENTGFSRGANLALQQLDTPWVLSLNPDCRLTPGFLPELLQAAAAHPQLGSATGLLLRGQGKKLQETQVVDAAGMVVSASGRHRDRGAGQPLRSKFLQPAWVFGATGACALYRRQALEDVAYPGGEVFDEAFFAYREDADLAWRLQRRGWRCLYWPRARAVHARGAKPEKGRHQAPEINFHSVKNRFLLRIANADWRWHVGCFPFWLLRDLLVLGACLTVERSSLPALRRLLALYPNQRAKGKSNQERACVSTWQLLPWFFPPWQVREYIPCG